MVRLLLPRAFTLPRFLIAPAFLSASLLQYALSVTSSALRRPPASPLPKQWSRAPPLASWRLRSCHSCCAPSAALSSGVTAHCAPLAVHPGLHTLCSRQRALLPCALSARPGHAPSHLRQRLLQRATTARPGRVHPCSHAPAAPCLSIPRLLFWPAWNPSAVHLLLQLRQAPDEGFLSLPCR